MAQGIPLDMDLIIFSDCLYEEQIVPFLQQSLLQVVPSMGWVLFSYRLRIKHREEPFFSALAEHFEIHVQLALEIMPSQMDAETAAGVYICLGQRRSMG